MADPKPVFVIHGVNVRGEKEFTELVKIFNQRVGNQWRFIPIYWGDLGGNDIGIDATIPGATFEADTIDAAALLRGGGGGTRAGAADIAATAAADRVRVQIPTRADTADVYVAVLEAWASADHLRLIEDPALAHEIGDAIGEAMAAAEDASSGAVRSDTRGFASGVVHAFNRALKAMVAQIIERLNRMLRVEFGPALARFLGDIFVYRETKTAIEKRLMDALEKENAGTEKNPATILAHSYGGVITFTMATRKENPIYVDKFVTFGSQSAFFHVIQPIGLVPQFTGRPVPVPRTISNWLNVWEPLDPLAFLIANVFTLMSGGTATDRRLSHDSDGSLWTHSAYWTDKRFARWIEEFL